MTKGEPEELQRTVATALSRMQPNSQPRQTLMRIGTALLGSRIFSMQEGFYMLTGLPLRGSSRTTVMLGVGYLDNRVRVVDSSAFRAAPEEVGEDEDAAASVPFKSNKIDYYRCRAGEPEDAERRGALQAGSESLEDVCLFNFITDYQVSTTAPGQRQVEYQDYWRVDIPVLLPNNPQRYITKRSRSAVPRIYPYMTPESHGEEFFYAQLMLYVPWRNERIDLLATRDGGQFDSYEQAFRAKYDRMRQRIGNAEYADRVEQMVQRLDALDPEARAAAYARAAPTGTQVEEADGALLDDLYNANDPYQNLGARIDAFQLAEGLAPNDVQAANVGEVNANAVAASLGAAEQNAGRGRMLDSVFEQNQALMSTDQRAVVVEVRLHMVATQRPNSVTPPLRLFVTGGAGTGKSFLIHILYDLIIRGHRGLLTKPVILTAPTGVAAFNIAGLTVHKALSLPVEHCRTTGNARVRYIKLSAAKLVEMRAFWYGVRYLIIDEISMVSSDTLRHVDRRLREIRDTPTVPFAGISIITVGDFYQLPPVKADYVFEPKNALRFGQLPVRRQANAPPLLPAQHLPLSPLHVWSSFQLRELGTNQRQRGDHVWAAHLNALRSNIDTSAVEQALEALRGRLTVAAGGTINECDDEWKDAPRLFAKNADVKSYNAKRLADTVSGDNEAVTIMASHRFVSAHGAPNLARRVNLNMVPESADDCGGLEAKVTLAIGARVMLRRNIHTDDGLVNGAVGVVSGFRWPQGGQGQGVVPDAIFVKFDNECVGRLLRAMDHLDPAGPVPIPIASSRFGAKGVAGRGQQVERKQFPLTLAWAITFHKVQGLSMERAVVDVGRSIFSNGQAYVGLSRVSKLTGLAISGMVDSSMKMVDPYVTEEYARMKSVAARPPESVTASGGQPLPAEPDSVPEDRADEADPDELAAWHADDEFAIADMAAVTHSQSVISTPHMGSIVAAAVAVSAMVSSFANLHTGSRQRCLRRNRRSPIATSPVPFHGVLTPSQQATQRHRVNHVMTPTRNSAAAPMDTDSSHALQPTTSQPRSQHTRQLFGELPTLHTSTSILHAPLAQMLLRQPTPLVSIPWYGHGSMDTWPPCNIIKIREEAAGGYMAYRVSTSWLIMVLVADSLGVLELHFPNMPTTNFPAQWSSWKIKMTWALSFNNITKEKLVYSTEGVNGLIYGSSRMDGPCHFPSDLQEFLIGSSTHSTADIEQELMVYLQECWQSAADAAGMVPLHPWQWA